MLSEKCDSHSQQRRPDVPSCIAAILVQRILNRPGIQYILLYGATLMCIHQRQRMLVQTAAGHHQCTMCA